MALPAMSWSRHHSGITMSLWNVCGLPVQTNSAAKIRQISETSKKICRKFARQCIFPAYYYNIIRCSTYRNAWALTYLAQGEMSADASANQRKTVVEGATGATRLLHRECRLPAVLLEQLPKSKK